jgi:hypothetical protein
MTQQVFDDRFLLTSPGLADLNLSIASDFDLENASPELATMAAMVRQYSVLLKKASTKSIYLLITQQVDPRIALILAAGRDNSGVRIFANLDRVKEAMFGPPDDTSSLYLSPQNNIFVQGIKRIACALTASILIGQLAQIEEQAKHSALLEEQALKDLQRILTIPDIQVTKSVKDGATGLLESFYFETKTVTLNVGEVIKVDVYIPSVTQEGWKPVGQYTGTFSTGKLISDLADYINNKTLVDKTSNIIAAPVLAGDSKLHRIDIQTRSRDSIISFEIVTVKIYYSTNDSLELPFNWGVSINVLQPQTINSVVVTVLNGKTSTTGLGTGTNRENQEPTVLYFKNADKLPNGDIEDALGNTIPKSAWAQSQKIVFRVSPTMEEDVSLDLPYITDTTNTLSEQQLLDNSRPSQLAELLLNQLFLIKGDVKCLGALIRSDRPNQPSALVAMELIAYTLVRNETWLILDLLKIPTDIEVAVGNINGPITPFSSKARSIRVKSTPTTLNNRFTDFKGQNPDIPLISKIPVSDHMQNAMQRAKETGRITFRGY